MVHSEPLVSMQRNEPDPNGAEVDPTTKQQHPGSANNADPAWDFGLHLAHAPWLVGDQNRALMIWAVPRS